MRFQFSSVVDSCCFCFQVLYASFNTRNVDVPTCPARDRIKVTNALTSNIERDDSKQIVKCPAWFPAGPCAETFALYYFADIPALLMDCSQNATSQFDQAACLIGKSPLFHDYFGWTEHMMRYVEYLAIQNDGLTGMLDVGLDRLNILKGFSELFAQR